MEVETLIEDQTSVVGTYIVVIVTYDLTSYTETLLKVSVMYTIQLNNGTMK